MQFPGQASVLGVIYATTMSRADSALAFALLCGLQGKREARVAGVAVSGAGLNTAVFCDVVGRFYAGPGPVANSNRTLPVGLVAEGTLPADSPILNAVVALRNEKVESPYPHSIEKISDSSESCRADSKCAHGPSGRQDGHSAIRCRNPTGESARSAGNPGTDRRQSEVACALRYLGGRRGHRDRPGRNPSYSPPGRRRSFFAARRRVTPSPIRLRVSKRISHGLRCISSRKHTARTGTCPTMRRPGTWPPPFTT